MAYIKAPKSNQQEMYDYLEDLRQSGATNMFGAGQYLEEAFDLDRDEASKILGDWMHGHDDPKRILKKSVTGRKSGRFVTSYEE